MLDRVWEKAERIVPAALLSIFLVGSFALRVGSTHAAEPIDIGPGTNGACLCIRIGGPTVTFGHGARHLPSTVSHAAVQSQITTNVRTQPLGPVGSFWNGWVWSKGTDSRWYLIQYNAYRVALDRVHVGTYYVIQ